MTRDRSTKLVMGAYEVTCRLSDQSRGYLVRKAEGPELVQYALHLIDPPADSAGLARREIERFSRLSHPALAALVEVFDHEDSLALVFERAEGLRLDRLKGYLDRDRERLPDAAVWQMGWQTMGALALAHLARDERGALAPFVHGMLSPRDILVTWDGEIRVEGLCPHLVSQGRPDEEVDRAPASVWLAPEVRRGDQPSAKSDAYSVAMILRALLTGRPPEAMGASFRPLASARPDLPGDVAHALDRALDAAPRLRPSCAELSQRLAGLANITASQAVLRESMELYQALWGLWSVAAPEVWSQEEPVLPGHEPETTDDHGDRETSADDSVPARDSTVELDWDDIEHMPRTSRSPGARLDPEPESNSEPGAGDQEPAEDDESPSSQSDTPAVRDAARQAARQAASEPRTAPALPPSSSAVPASSGRLETIPGQPPTTGGWGRWLAMGALAVAAAAAAWHTIGPDTTDPSDSSTSATAEPGKPPLAAAASVSDGGGTTAGRRPITGRHEGSHGAKGTAPRSASTETTQDDAAQPPPGKLLSFQGYLTVKSSVAAEVYVKGVSIGPTNHKNVSHCGQKFVRLGRPPGPRWLSAGATAQVACRGETTVPLEPDADVTSRP
jgi:hypothetical protein